MDKVEQQQEQDRTTSHPPTDFGPEASGDPVVSGLRRAGLLLLAGLFFVLAALGVVLPVLPTTPFLLLTSYFLVRSSPRLNAALLKSRLFGPVLTDWYVRRGVRRVVKIRAVVTVGATVAISLYMSAPPFWLTLAAIALALFGIGYVLRLPEPNDGPPAI